MVIESPPPSVSCGGMIAWAVPKSLFVKETTRFARGLEDPSDPVVVAPKADDAMAAALARLVANDLDGATAAVDRMDADVPRLALATLCGPTLAVAVLCTVSGLCERLLGRSG